MSIPHCIPVSSLYTTDTSQLFTRPATVVVYLLQSNHITHFTNTALLSKYYVTTHKCIYYLLVPLYCDSHSFLSHSTAMNIDTVWPPHVCIYYLLVPLYCDSHSFLSHSTAMNIDTVWPPHVYIYYLLVPLYCDSHSFLSHSTAMNIDTVWPPHLQHTQIYVYKYDIIKFTKRS